MKSAAALSEREFPRRVYLVSRTVGSRKPCCKCGQIFQPTTKRRISCETCFLCNSRTDDGAITQMDEPRVRPRARGC